MPRTEQESSAFKPMIYLWAVELESLRLDTRFPCFYTPVQLMQFDLISLWARSSKCSFPNEIKNNIVEAMLFSIITTTVLLYNIQLWLEQFCPALLSMSLKYMCPNYIWKNQHYVYTHNRTEFTRINIYLYTIWNPVQLLFFACCVSLIPEKQFVNSIQNCQFPNCNVGVMMIWFRRILSVWIQQML